mmetsp:Transcript_56454/g.145350  ORF Transcript_56454/g.145350 Transcript_56454/m.145350 type:complete len:322 (+) Transcript_56454:264-1229(+)
MRPSNAGARTAQPGTYRAREGVGGAKRPHLGSRCGVSRQRRRKRLLADAALARIITLPWRGQRDLGRRVRRWPRADADLRCREGMRANYQGGRVDAGACPDLRKRILVRPAAAGDAECVEAPAAARLPCKPRDDQAVLAAGLPQGVPAQLRAAAGVHHAAEGVGDLCEGVVRSVDVDDEADLRDIRPDAVQVHDDLLVIAVPLAREVVARVPHAVRLRLQAAEEDRLQVLPGRVHEHRGDVQVALPVVHVPAEAHDDLAHVHGQVQNAALLHGEGDLLLRGRRREEATDDLGEQRQDVHEVLATLRGLVDGVKLPRARAGL